jgi:excisionase family DNA binding protein
VELLTIREACDRLKLSRASLYRLIQSGQLPSVRIGRSRRVVSEDLDRFIAALRSGSPVEGGRAKEDRWCQS